MSSVYALTMDWSEIDEDDFTDAELRILHKLEEGRATPGYLAEELDLTPEYVRARLRELERLSIIHKVHRGLYELAEGSEQQAE